LEQLFPKEAVLVEVLTGTTLPVLLGMLGRTAVELLDIPMVMVLVVV
jgi:hypothetical protein